MQRVLVIVAVIVLVMVSLGVGALSANWPFWRRAWSWHAGAEGWPSVLTGARTIVQGGGATPLDFAAAAPELAAAAASADTHALLRVRSGQADAWFAPGFDATTLVDARGLTRLLLWPLYHQLEADHPALLDQPVGAWLDAWRQDQRGAITLRELLHLATSELQAPPAPSPLNPFLSRSRLASGGNFERAALAVFDRDAAPGANAPAAAQLLAAVAEEVEGRPYAQVLQSGLWSHLAARDAVLMLDRRRGQASAHCCMQATLSDWLQAGLALTRIEGDAPAARHFTTAGRTLWLQPPGAAVLWVGAGSPPSALENLLDGATGTDEETSAPE
jgi:CubicO group peptidase (beta-lactamase class C family)